MPIPDCLSLLHTSHRKPSCKLLFLYMLALFKLQQQRAATLSFSMGDYNICIHGPGNTYIVYMYVRTYIYIYIYIHFFLFRDGPFIAIALVAGAPTRGMTGWLPD